MVCKPEVYRCVGDDQQMGMSAWLGKPHSSTHKPQAQVTWREAAQNQAKHSKADRTGATVMSRIGQGRRWTSLSTGRCPGEERQQGAPKGDTVMISQHLPQVGRSVTLTRASAAHKALRSWSAEWHRSCRIQTRATRESPAQLNQSDQAEPCAAEPERSGVRSGGEQ